MRDLRAKAKVLVAAAFAIVVLMMPAVASAGCIVEVHLGRQHVCI